MTRGQESSSARRSLRAGILDRALRSLSCGFIIAFHEIPPGRLVEIVEDLGAFHPAPLDEIVARRKKGLSTGGMFAITVDDGVGSNVRAVAAAARVRRWPVTFYLPTGYIDSRCAMPFQWWRAVAPLLPRKPLRLNGETVDLAQEQVFRRLSRRMERLWRTQRMDSYLPLLTDLIDSVCRERGMPRQELKLPAPVSPKEIRELARDELVRFESHGVTHAALSAMSPEEIAEEMERSRDRVEQLSGSPCRHFCYPFGSPESIGEVAPQLARRFYDSAVTMSLGNLDRADPWLLPRVPLYPENRRVAVRCKIALQRGL